MAVKKTKNSSNTGNNRRISRKSANMKSKSKGKENNTENSKGKSRKKSDSQLSRNNRSRKESIMRHKGKSKMTKGEGSSSGIAVGRKPSKSSPEPLTKKRPSSSNTERATPAPKPGKRKRKANDDSVEMVPVKQFSKWQPVKQTTFTTVMQIVDSNISHVLSLCSARVYEDIQEHLMTLKSRFQNEMNTLKAPVPVADYNNVSNMLASLSKDMAEGKEQLERIEEEIDRVTGLLDEGRVEENNMNKALAVAEGKIQQQANSGDLNTDVLNLPAYSTRQTRQVPDCLSSDDQAIRECMTETWEAKQQLNSNGYIEKT